MMNPLELAEAMVCVSDDAIGIGMPDGSLGSAVKVVPGVDLRALRERWVRYIAAVLASEALKPAPVAEQTRPAADAPAGDRPLTVGMLTRAVKAVDVSVRGKLALSQMAEALEREARAGGAGGGEPPASAVPKPKSDFDATRDEWGDEPGDRELPMCMLCRSRRCEHFKAAKARGVRL